MSSLQTRLSFITKRPYWWLYLLGLVLLLATAWLWWVRVHLGPSQVFWGMLQNSLATQGVTAETEQVSGENHVRQTVQYELGSINTAHSITNLSQGATKVQTEIIGTSNTDYTRYRSIETPQLRQDGRPLDVSKVVDVWTKSDPIPQSETQGSGHQLLAQAVLGIGLPVGSVPVPIGNLPPKERAKLFNQIKEQNVYETSFKDAKRETRNGRLHYVYDVKIQPILYVRLMKQFAAELGFHELDKVDPNAYSSSEALRVKLVVDAHSRQLTAVEHEGTNIKQTYKGYGVPVRVTLPDKTISTDELQKRLNSL